VTTLPVQTVIAETQSELNVEPSFPRTETDVVACTIQCKNNDTTGVFFLIRKFNMATSFSNAKIEKKSYMRVNTVLLVPQLWHIFREIITAADCENFWLHFKLLAQSLCQHVMSICPKNITM
jgi:hypothetical protein